MKIILYALTLSFMFSVQAANFDGQIPDWKKSKEDVFSSGETNFKLVLKKLMTSYLDKSVTEDELYRAATAGMLAALNSGKEHEDFNVLLSPRMLQDFMIEKSGKLTGIGATLALDDKLGLVHVIDVLPNSPALKAGLTKDDIFLSVNGEKMKGKNLAEVVALVRGPAGQTVHLKVLRDDQIIKFAVARDQVSLRAFEAKQLNPSTAYLMLGFFTSETSERVEAALKEFNQKGLRKLILDLRGNGGGTFDDAVKTAELFLPKGTTVVQTVSRDGKVERYEAKHEAWRPEVQLVVLTDHETASSAELLTGALKEGRKATVVGLTTQGKWNAQSLETLSNKFAVKYTVYEFETASGKSFQGTGFKPDITIDGPKGAALAALHNESDLSKRIDLDAPLKAALSLQ